MAVYNLQKRGYERMDLSLYSLNQQEDTPAVIVVDGSTDKNYEILAEICKQYHNTRHVRLTIGNLNLPKLFNRGAILSETDYLHFTGADFVYRRDFFEELEPLLNPRQFILTPVKMGSASAKFTRDSIDNWAGWPLRDDWGEYAPGIQTFHKSFFRDSQGYDEEMEGWSGMDDDMIYRAESYGLKRSWIRTSEVYHIYHPAFKLKDDNYLRQSKKNWARRDKYKRTGFNWKERQ